MVVFGHIWFKRKGLFGIGLDSACRQLDAATLTNAIDTGIERPSPDQIAVLWLVLRLYEFLPSVFHPLANATVTGEYHWMYKIMREVGSLRWSNFLNQFRTLATDIFDGTVPHECFKKGFNSHEDPECQHLLGFKSDRVYDRHPPCLFAGNFKLGATIFRTIYGVRILTCLLWGNMALDNQKIITKGTYADLWHVNEVNSVAIAFAAIVTRYLLMGDTDFAAVGKKSSINYMADFEYYVEHLEDQLKKDRRYQVPTTVPKSLNEEEEDFWHEIEALDKEPDFDSNDPAPLMTPVVSGRTPSQLVVSSQVDLPVMPTMQVANDSEAHSGMTDANDNVRSRAKGKKGSNKAVPTATRKKGHKGQQESSNSEGLPVPSASIVAMMPATTFHVTPIQGSSMGINVEEGPGNDDDDDDDMEDEDE
ncbi:hypothetical protein EDD18DRAFT_1357736 [Armillaria luteobubalina]|uniref:Uncharacterized protein n=1 Tax=Armillaria luteobubalina TaxID=153913 RepID=A0AA39UTR1_9AGAR|nr:hypothetical protein EDD18DRAFT_1357736 [Armillaria luteobubalina]